MNQHAVTILRVTLGLFLFVWGGDKLVNADHAVAVSEGFYFGLVSSSFVVTAGGILQIALGLLIIAGRYQTVAYGGLLIIVTATLLAVWKSILDPLEVYMEGGNPVFFSSAVIWSASWLLWTTRVKGDATAPSP